MHLPKNGLSRSAPGRCAASLLLAACAVAWSAAPADWSDGAGFRYRELPSPPPGPSGFTLIPAPASAVFFTNVLGEDRSLTNQILHNGSGVALGDVDGDGLCDLYLGRLDGPNALYRNLGHWKFEDVTARSGAGAADLDTTGVLLLDLDGDGDLDLLVNALGRGTSVLLNDGRGKFTDATATAGTATAAGTTSLAAGDVDGDGDLDLYITNYRTVTLRDQPQTRFTINLVDGKPVVASVNGRPTTAPDLAGRFTVDDKGAIAEHGEPDILFRNEGGGRFTAVRWDDGTFLDEEGRPVAAPHEFGLSVMLRDLNGDGAPDLYVCNDFEGPDRIWMNDGRGRFRPMPLLALRQTPVFSMGVDVADLDRDGFDDIFVVDMLSREHTRRMVQLGDRKPVFSQPGRFLDRPQYMRNALFWNRGDGTYAEVAQFAGLEATDWSWTPIFLDVDLDGYEDLLVSNGHERDAQNVDYARRVEALKKERRLNTVEQLRLRKVYPPLHTSSFAFRNRGGLRFEEVTAAWGFAAPGAKQGMALADLDNDGDLDVVVNQLNGPALLYRNEAAAPRLQVRLKGRAPNTRGIGAKIRVLGGPVPQSQEMIAGGRFLSGDEAVRTFAAGSATNALTIEVTWRSGARSVIEGARANRVYEVDEAGARPAVPTTSTPPAPWFRDVTSALGHTHHDEEFNDFERQPLLVRKLSQAGPGVAWFDVDGDGREDLLVGSGRGGAMAVLRNDGRGGFTNLAASLPAGPEARDQSAVLGLVSGGRRTIVAGSSNFEDGRTNGGVARVYDPATGMILDDLPGQESSTGPLALADVDGDGALDLFVGGRVIPGRYPEAASSLLFRGTNGSWTADAKNTKLLVGVGLVTSAVFSDLDADGWPDLVLACEWGPLKLFRNLHGTLEAWNPPLTPHPSPFSPPSPAGGTAWRPAISTATAAWTSWRGTGARTAVITATPRSRCASPTAISMTTACSTRWRARWIRCCGRLFRCAIPAWSRAPCRSSRRASPTTPSMPTLAWRKWWAVRTGCVNSRRTPSAP